MCSTIGSICPGIPKIEKGLTFYTTKNAEKRTNMFTTVLSFYSGHRILHYDVSEWIYDNSKGRIIGFNGSRLGLKTQINSIAGVRYQMDVITKTKQRKEQLEKQRRPK